jgi:hypothetical protein
MSSILLKSGAACVVAALALAGCGQPSTPESGHAAATPATAATAATVTAVTATSVAAAGSAALPGDNVSTPRYRIAIHYPTLSAQEAALAQALRDNSVAAKREFMQALPDPQQFPEFADRQLELQLDYTVAARTAAFTSVRERGMSNTGGAHPIPVDASFVYDVQAQRMIALDDLFTDPDAARQRLSTLAANALREKLLAQAPAASEASPEARREWVANMQQMIDDGTRPTAANFSVFVVHAGPGDTADGLTLIFPPYQVAPYVYGTQTVEVPAEVFASLLKPGYRDAFAH